MDGEDAMMLYVCVVFVSCCTLFLFMLFFFHAVCVIFLSCCLFFHVVRQQTLGHTAFCVVLDFV